MTDNHYLEHVSEAVRLLIVALKMLFWPEKRQKKWNIVFKFGGALHAVGEFFLPRIYIEPIFASGDEKGKKCRGSAASRLIITQ